MVTVPNVDKSRLNRLWNMKDIYTGPQGTGQYVPNVDDMVYDWDSGIWRVISVDYGVTNISYMVSVNLANIGGGIDEDNVSIVSGVGANDNSFAIYVNNKTLPHTLTFDSRSRWYGSDNSYVKVFKGTDITASTGTVVSALLDAQGNAVTENIPLETVLIQNATNISQKTPKSGFCTGTLTTGEIVTVVTYTNSGGVSSIDKFVIVETDYVRTLDASATYIADIEIVSPFISKSDSRVIECPINMVKQSLTLQAKVTYQDGTSQLYPIDGKKFSIAGLDTFVASTINQQMDIVLFYHLSDGELSTDASANTPDRRMAKDYKLTTTAVDTFYQIKLFALPYWSNNQYQLKWFMYNLERKDVTDVTGFIEYGVGQPQFNGTLYGAAQSLLVAVNMKAISSSNAYYRHVENVIVTLVSPATVSAANTYFTLAYSDLRRYGDNLTARFTNDAANAGMQKINVSSGFTDTASWLNAVYANIEPIYYSINEMTAPAPTHARVIIDGYLNREVAIENILSDIGNIPSGITQAMSLRLEFIRRNGDVVYELGAAPMVVTAMLSS